MFDRFTPRARQVIVVAQDEARELTYDYIGTEHLLPAAAQTEGVRPLTDGPYTVGGR
jgi:ATP-dependent Clp protease ATP-binding subunit ClpA